MVGVWPPSSEKSAKTPSEEKPPAGPKQQPPASSSTPSSLSAAPSSSSSSSSSSAVATSSSSSTAAPSAASSAQFAILTEKEKSDPLSVELLESNDVLESAIEAVQKEMAALLEVKKRSEEQEDLLLSLQCRLPVLQSKLIFLVDRVQSEKLTLPDYLEMIKDRLQRDKVLAVYLRSLKSKVIIINIFCECDY